MVFVLVIEDNLHLISIENSPIDLVIGLDGALNSLIH